MQEVGARMQQAFPGLTVHTYEIKNHFFGENITVAGLLTAGDIIAQLQGKALGEVLLLPAAVLRSEGDMFLDDKTPAEVEEALGCRVCFVENDGAALATAILGEE
jgi:NifB/MoaA-like Fe-S oxidoreductase